MPGPSAPPASAPVGEGAGAEAPRAPVLRRPAGRPVRSAAKRKSWKLAQAEAAHRGDRKRRAVGHREDHPDVLPEVDPADYAAVEGDQPEPEGGPLDPDPGAAQELPTRECEVNYSYIRYVREYSPGRNRQGRRPHVTFSNKKNWTSAKELEQMAPLELAEHCFDHGILPDRRSSTCPRCQGEQCTLQLRARGDEPVYRCTGKGACQAWFRLQETCQDVFPDGSPLRQQLVLLWHFATPEQGPAATRVAQILNMHPRTGGPLPGLAHHLGGSHGGAERRAPSRRLGR